MFLKKFFFPTIFEHYPFVTFYFIAKCRQECHLKMYIVLYNFAETVCVVTALWTLSYSSFDSFPFLYKFLACQDGCASRDSREEVRLVGEEEFQFDIK